MSPGSILAPRTAKAVLPASHRLADSNGPIDLGHLRNDPMVLLDAPPSSNHAYFCCARAGFTPHVVYRARTYETARSFVPPTGRKGFGTTVLENMVGRSLGAQVERIVHPDGLEWRFAIPLSAIDPSRGPEETEKPAN